MGSINDVAPVSASEFYMTQWRPAPIAATGRDPDGVASLLELVYYIFNPFGLQWTHIHRCVGVGAAATCRVVGPPAIAWNGIVVLDEHTVVAADVFATESLSVLDRDPTTGNLTLRYKVPGVSKVGGLGVFFFFFFPSLSSEASFIAPHKVDNLMVAADGDLWGAGVTLLPETKAMLSAAISHPHLLRDEDTRTRAHGRPVRAGSQAVRLHVATNATLRYTHDGALLGGWSVAYPATGTGYLLAGSFFDNGALVCAIAGLVRPARGAPEDQ